MKERPQFISIGIITKAYGVKGAVVVTPLTDEPQQFKELKAISIDVPQQDRQFFTIEWVRFSSKRILLKLAEVNDRNQAFTLKNLYIDKHLDQCKAPATDEYYIFDLIGLKVKTTDDVWRGEVSAVLTLPANDVYVVKNNSREYLLPAIKEVIKKIDLEQGYILIKLIDGLL